MIKYLMPQGNTLTVVRELGLVHSHRHYVYECSICSKDKELWPEGSIFSSLQRVKEGSAPCGCSRRPLWTEHQYYIRAKRSAESKGLVFVGWAGNFSKQETRAVVKCQVHGPIEILLKSLIHHSSVCRRCHFSTSTRQTTLEMLKTRAEFTGVEVVELPERLSLSAKLCLRCPRHGVWQTRVGVFVDMGCGCPACGVTGFRQDKEAWLYALRSECGGYLKVGISNAPSKRFSQLAATTPFGFTEVGVFKVGGPKARLKEKAIHGAYETAGFKGFNGATEWLKYNPGIIEDLQYL